MQETGNARLEHGSIRSRKKSGLPFVLVNMAMTADGKIATANRIVSSFGSRHDHDNLLALRATADAVMCGARTADLNDINLGPGPKKYRMLRLKRGLAEYNLRVLVSGSGSINPRAAIFRFRPTPLPHCGNPVDLPDTRLGTSTTASPIIILTTRKCTLRSRKKLSAVSDELKICGASQIKFPAALRWLKQKWGVNRLLCEGGGELNDALFRAGLVDELHLTICPNIFGGRSAPTIAEGIGFGKLELAANFRLKSSRRVGNEMFLVYSRPLGSVTPAVVFLSPPNAP